MSVTTAEDLIEQALSKILVLGVQDTLSDADTQKGLDTLNLMLDGWHTEGLMVYATKEDTKVLTGMDGQYTIGSGGDINVTRPVKITDAYVLGSGVRYPLDLMGQVRWDALSYPATYGIPRKLFYDPQYPLGIINLYPIPATSAYTLYLHSYLQIESFATLTEAFSLPPGYARAIIANLAVELCPDFGKAIDPVLAKIAFQSKNALKRLNAREVVAKIDSALLPRGGMYDINSDSMR